MPAHHWAQNPERTLGLANMGFGRTEIQSLLVMMTALQRACAYERLHVHTEPAGSWAGQQGFYTHSKTTLNHLALSGKGTLLLL